MYSYIKKLKLKGKIEIERELHGAITKKKNFAINLCTVGHILSLKRRRMSLLLFTTLVFF